MEINFKRGVYMNKEVAMKISAIIISAITLYTVIIWQPKDNGEIIEENLNDINNVFSSENKEENSSIFQVDDISLVEDTNNISIDNVKDSAEGLGTLVIEEKTFDEIINKISLKEKEEISDVLKKLSITDCSKIDSFLNQEDNSKALDEALQFIRKRLSAKDYERFQEILSKYIDLTNINSNI